MNLTSYLVLTRQLGFIVLVNEHFPNDEAKLVTQIHESVHARDFANGLTDEAFHNFNHGKEIELMTDIRAYVFAADFLSEDFYKWYKEFKKFAETKGISAGYFQPTPQDINLLKTIAEKFGNPRINMIGFLKGLIDSLDSPQIKQMLLNSRVCQNLKNLPDNVKIELIHKALEDLITLEDKTTFPQIIPENI